MPIVLTGLTDKWGVRKWTPTKIKELFGHLIVPIEFRDRNKKHGVPSDTNTVDVRTTTVESFVNWLQQQTPSNAHPHKLRRKTKNPAVVASNAPSSPSALPAHDKYSAYMSYQHFRNLFGQTADAAIARPALPWNTLGAKNVAAMDSTLWVGSGGAFTALHYDSYGANLHMQVA